MALFSIEIPEELSSQLTQLGDKLPELLHQCLVQSPLPAQVYHYILTFIASQPTPEQISQFRPSPEMQSRLHTLLNRSQSGKLTPSEKQ